MNPDNPNFRTAESWEIHYNRLKEENETLLEAITMLRWKVVDDLPIRKWERTLNRLKKILGDTLWEKTFRPSRRPR